MADGKSRHDWSLMTSLLCLTANVNRDSRRPAYRPADFDPFSEHEEVIAKVDISILKTVFVDGGLPVV